VAKNDRINERMKSFRKGLKLKGKKTFEKQKNVPILKYPFAYE
jgi:hypothetical protein